MFAAAHPFYPLDTILYGYVKQDLSTTAIFGAFGTACLSLATVTHAYCKAYHPYLSTSDLWLAIWFVLSGCIHLFIEGYFSLFHATMPARTDWLGQAWKEYAHSDSRYMTADPFVVCMESVTAWAWGPLCLLAAWMIVRGSSWRHPVQMIVSSGQIYGDVLYYMTNVMDEVEKGLVYSRPEPLYYWAYFVGMNAVWLVIPGYCIVTSMKEIAAAFGAAKHFMGPTAEKKRK